MEQSSIYRRRQQSVPHSGVRDALLAPAAAPALPDAVRSVFNVEACRERAAATASPLLYDFQTFRRRRLFLFVRSRRVGLGN